VSSRCGGEGGAVEVGEGKEGTTTREWNSLGPLGGSGFGHDVS
jgi:hypothetical protein